MARILRTCCAAAVGLVLTLWIPACDDNGLVIEFPTPIDSYWWDGFAEQGMNDYVYALEEYQGDLVAGGLFTTAGTELANGIARWDGTSWSAFGNGMIRDDCITGFCQAWVSAMTLFEEDLVVGGRFTQAGGVPASNVARWDGTQWSALGDGFDDTVFALTQYEGRLIAGGIFSRSGNDSTVAHLAQWNGSTWEVFAGGTDATVRALLNWGSSLIVGGDFQTAGLETQPFVAEWDGSTWTGFPPFLDGSVQTALLFADKLIVGGDFFWAGAEEPDYIRLSYMGMWGGNGWSPLGNFNDDVTALVSYRNQLVSGGAFTYADGQVNYVARLDPQLGWLSFGSGLDRRVTSLRVHDGHLYIGGWFRLAGGKPSRYIARWDGELSPNSGSYRAPASF